MRKFSLDFMNFSLSLTKFSLNGAKSSLTFTEYALAFPGIDIHYPLHEGLKKTLRKILRYTAFELPLSGNSNKET